jgi:dolichol-phosphate mannosyltransferase
MCSESVQELSSRLQKTLAELTEAYEIIFVNDASPQNDWDIVCRLAEQDKRIIGVNLSRNFGQHLAITAGVHHCRGEWVVVMDGDLQDQPEFIAALYEKALEGYEIVFGRRVVRQDTFFKKTTSKWFAKTFDYLTGIKNDGTAGNFGIFNRIVIDNYLKFDEHYRVFPLLIRWQGFNVGYVDIEHGKRLYGKSSYNYFKLFNMALDVIVSQSNKPLEISIKIGFFLSVFSFFYLCFLVVRSFLYEVPLGWTSLMMSTMFVGGLLFANLGLLGLYIGKIYDETKNRPLFIVKETTGCSVVNAGNRACFELTQVERALPSETVLVDYPLR